MTLSNTTHFCLESVKTVSHLFWGTLQSLANSPYIENGIEFEVLLFCNVILMKSYY